MAPTKKSIYRQPGAQHFQLVHRSVRDPLINDPDASQQVFKPVERYNDAQKSGVTLAELDATLDKTKMRANEGEAAQYGITFDDSAYDYMAHLRPVGEAGFESVLLEAPKGSAAATGMKRQGNRSKGKGREDDMFLPPDALASRNEISWQEAQDAHQAIPAELQGFQPDMDPHLRQVLEALDDDEFVDDDGDLFDDLLGGGELEDGDEAPDFEFAEWGVDEQGRELAPPRRDDDDDDDSKTEDGETWEDRFRAFKAAGGRHPEQKATSNGGWDDDEADPEERSEMADTIGSLVSGFGDMVVRGGKKRHGKRGPSDASGMSMSSASVYRNAGLRSLDDRFDVIEREYELEDDDDEYIDYDDDDNVSLAPSFMSSMSRASMASKAAEDHGPVELSREDFDSIMDDFLDNYEVVGSRMRESLGGTALSGAEKLSVLRAALEQGEDGDGIGREENRRRILELEQLNRGYVKEKKEKVALRDIDEKAEPKWDVETILSTYTNTENHPGTIRIRSSEEQKARLLRRAEEAEKAAARAAAKALPVEEDDEGSGSETEREYAPKVTVARPKGESAEERKARKNAVKEQRANRRQEKKKHTETFGAERKRQIASHQKMVGGGRAADVAVGARGVVSLK
ncbi:Protein ltv1 [Vanrija albida]|uniref:Protein ltv1 n=1 Tax=Vanrija albida TaxID=181172 RepID=A0ABR3PRI8_9TREE